jgi:hypothetical protein
LAGFAADANAGVEFHVITNVADLLQDLRAITD